MYVQFLIINENTSLNDLSRVVGYQNVDAVLALNGMQRTPNVGSTLKAITDSAKSIEIADTDSAKIQRKTSLLNQCSSDSDVFAAVSRLDDSGWNVYAYTGTFENMLKVPDYVNLPNTDSVLGNSNSVSKSDYDAVINAITNGTQVPDGQVPATVSETLFSRFSGATPFNWFNLPLGKITLYSSLAGSSIEFPCYPSEFSDGFKANYDTMPDMLYQYEPWQVYKGSGPRQCTLTFDMHRDMWSGNHNDGKCNELLRFCEANCYPEYNGAAVNTATVTLYIDGKALISGIMTDATPNWDTDSPIGHDGFYLHVKLSITIIEVSQSRLDYSTFRSKGLIE